MKTSEQHMKLQIISRRMIVATTGIVAILTVACSQQAVAPVGKAPAAQNTPPAEVAGLRPGLTVRYYSSRFRHIDEMPSGSRETQWGRPGDPVRIINHRFGTGNVFGSGMSRKVGVLMCGYIHLERSGRYRFRACSNDGVRVWIGDTVVINDPDVHPERVVESEPLTILRAGWHPFKLKYFQNKGSATLEFYWQPPDASDFTIVPGTAYGHMPK